MPCVLFPRFEWEHTPWTLHVRPMEDLAMQEPYVYDGPNVVPKSDERYGFDLSQCRTTTRKHRQASGKPDR